MLQKPREYSDSKRNYMNLCRISWLMACGKQSGLEVSVARTSAC